MPGPAATSGNKADKGDKRAWIFYNTVKLQNQHWDLDFVT